MLSALDRVILWRQLYEYVCNLKNLTGLRLQFLIQDLTILTQFDYQNIGFCKWVTRNVLYCLILYVKAAIFFFFSILHFTHYENELACSLLIKNKELRMG